MQKMLKGLSLTLLVLVSIRILPAQNPPKGTPKQEVPKANSGQKGQARTQPQTADQGSPKLIPPAQQPPTPGCDEACQNARQNLQIQNRLVWLTGGLVLVGVLQVGSMIWQAWLLRQTREEVHRQGDWMKKQARLMARQGLSMRRQTTLLRKSADAALLNAQAVINAERARLLFEVVKEPNPKLGPGFSTFTICAKNYGRSPAEILGVIEQEFAVVKNPYDLPLPIPARPPFPPVKRYAAPDDRAQVAVFNPRSSTVEQRTFHVVNETGMVMTSLYQMVYGEVRYKDGISDETRHSRYCFRFDREPFSNIGGSLVPDGPPDYNECS